MYLSLSLKPRLSFDHVHQRCSQLMMSCRAAQQVDVVVHRGLSLPQVGEFGDDDIARLVGPVNASKELQGIFLQIPRLSEHAFTQIRPVASWVAVRGATDLALHEADQRRALVLYCETRETLRTQVFHCASVSSQHCTHHAGEGSCHTQRPNHCLH